MSQEILRGDLYYADLNPVIGSEQGGVRPVLVIQNDVGNRHSPTVIVAAITCRDKPRLPTHVSLAAVKELEPSSIVLLEQIRTVDKRRLTWHVGNIGEEKMSEIDAALTASVGL